MTYRQAVLFTGYSIRGIASTAYLTDGPFLNPENVCFFSFYETLKSMLPCRTMRMKTVKMNLRAESAFGACCMFNDEHLIVSVIQKRYTDDKEVP